MKFSSTRFFTFVSLLGLSLSAGFGATTEIRARIQKVAAIQHQFLLKQTKIASCQDISSTLQWGKNYLTYVDGELSITGTDEQGRTYRAEIDSGAAGCEVWSADLDGNGESDLMIFTPGEDSSGGYDSELSVLLFDKTGRPFPWKAAGKFTTGENGIEQIILNSSSAGHADVIIPTKEGIAGPNASLAFQLYSFSPSAVSKVTGAALGSTWPIFANATRQLTEHQSAVSLAFDQRIPKPPVRLEPKVGVKITSTSQIPTNDGSSLEPPAILVEDSADGSRLINFDPIPSDITKLMSQSVQVTQLGRSCEEEECRPMIWLTKP